MEIEASKFSSIYNQQCSGLLHGLMCVRVKMPVRAYYCRNNSLETRHITDILTAVPVVCHFPDMNSLAINNKDGRPNGRPTGRFRRSVTLKPCVAVLDLDAPAGRFDGSSTRVVNIALQVA